MEAFLSRTPVFLTLLALLVVATLGLVIFAQKRMAGRPNSLNRGANGLIGQEFRLDTAITEGFGRIRVNDTVWRVSGADAPAGTRIRVTGIEGTVLIVTTA